MECSIATSSASATGVAGGEHARRRADGDSGRGSQHVGSEQRRRGDPAVLHEVVLGKPHAAEAVLLGGEGVRQGGVKPERTGKEDVHRHVR